MAKKQGLGNKLILLDLIFYAAIPFVLWKYGREPFGDYAAMLISTIPGIVYTCYRFFKEKQFNIAGMFILGSLVLGTTVDLLSGSAEQMLWNGVYLSLFYVAIHFVALVMKRPLALYFAVDFAYLQGHARRDSKSLFFQKGIFKWFQVIQFLFIVRGLIMAALTVFLLKQYGVDGYSGMLIYKRIASGFFGILTMALYFYTSVPIQKFLDEQAKNASDLQDEGTVTDTIV